MSFVVWYVGIYPVILTWYQSLDEGRLSCWSRSEAGVTARDDCSQDLLFLTIFWDGRTAPLCSKCHFKWGFPFVLYEKVSVFPSYGHFIVPKVYNSFFCSHHLFLSALFRFQSLFIYFTEYVTFFSTYDLCNMPLCNLLKIKNRREIFFLSYVCSHPCASLWSRPIKSSKKSLQFSVD